MGLDMYAFAVPKGTDLTEINQDQKQELDYWRKHHDLHGWMEALYRSKGGDKPSFNCVPVQLTAEDLDHLESDVINRSLPHTEGFFFGNNPPDMESDLKDLCFIQKARLYLRDGWDVYYDSWW